MEHRIFFEKQLHENQKIVFKKTDDHEEWNHLKNVMRLNVGESVLLMDGKGKRANAKIIEITKDAIIFTIEKIESIGPADQQIILCQAVLKGAKMDWLIEKITELGINVLQPIHSEYCQIPLKNLVDKNERWGKIAKAAIKQSGNAFLPQINTPLECKDFLQTIPREAMKIFCHPQGKSLLQYWQEMPTDWNQNTNFYLFVGPEGGFSASEIEVLQQNGAKPVSLGKNILRSETASIAAVILLTHWIEVLPLIRYK